MSGASRVRRVVLVGSSAVDAIERYYLNAFRALGVEADLLDPERMLVPIRRRRILNRLTFPMQHHVAARAMREFFGRAAGFDLVFVFKGYFIEPDVIEECRKRTPGAQWINFNPDSPFGTGRGTANVRIRASIPLYDVYFSWSRALVSELLAHGARRAEHLCFGFDEAMHHPAERIDDSLARTVTFVGSFDRQRSSLLEAIADLPILIHGNAWEDLSSGSRLSNKIVSKAIHGPDLRRVVTSSLASINILRPQNQGSHNMRTFEVPAMGGVMLTSRSSEQAGFFPEGEASLMYDGPDELRRVVLRLLAGEYDVGRIRARARELSAPHSYVARALQVLEAVAH